MASTSKELSKIKKKKFWQLKCHTNTNDIILVLQIDRYLQRKNKEQR